ncbi:hypothetical protein VAA_03289 [Vibrio anguillarum 775]|nr:hypothetical protein VAA_03289 [Vibrio anguillarum 775]ARV26901.1 hypothetical protein A6A12_1711 [Vibrio anguillarum]
MQYSLVKSVHGLFLLLNISGIDQYKHNIASRYHYYLFIIIK